MNILVIGGFLGSGKTTVLLQLAKYLVARATPEDGCPVVILVNEISTSGVDNQLLSQANLTVENVFSGCICCTSNLQMTDAIKDIERKYSPAWIIIEATGVAYPDQIKQVLSQSLNRECSISAIVDAKRWNRLVRAMEDFVASQLRDADYIFLNKMDTVSGETLDGILQSVRQHNSSAVVCPVCALEPFDQQEIRAVLKALDLS